MFIFRFRNPNTRKTEACTQVGSRSCLGISDSSSGSPEGLRCVVVPSSEGGSTSFELHSQSTEERATSDRYLHFHGYSDVYA